MLFNVFCLIVSFADLLGVFCSFRGVQAQPSHFKQMQLNMDWKIHTILPSDLTTKFLFVLWKLS